MTHQELIDLAASYALDALDLEERARYEAHLAGCAECQREVAAYREVAAMLPYAAPAAQPPDTLRDRVLREARQVRPITATSAVPDRHPARVRTGNGEPRGVAIRAPEERGVGPGASRTVAPRGRGTVVSWTLAVASLAAAVVLGFVYRGERERGERLRAELAAAQATIARDDSTLAAFIGPEVHVVSLAAANRKPNVRVFWNHTRQTFIVTAFGLPQPPEGKTYQLWAIRNGKPPLSMGTFDVDASGRTTTTVAVARSITDGGFIDDCALTLEPAGGSPQPTEEPRMIGSWRHVD